MSARLFSRMNAGFRVGGNIIKCNPKASPPEPCPNGPCPNCGQPVCDCPVSCDCTKIGSDSNCEDGGNNNNNTRKRNFCTDQTTESNCKTAGGRTFISPNTCKWTGPPGKTPTGISFNCSGSTCVPVSGAKGKYNNLSDCNSSCNGSPKPPGSDKFSCSGSTCISDSKGTYNASDCSDSCGFSCNASNTCISGLSGSGTYDTKDECQKKCSSSIWTSWWMIMIYIVAGLFFILLIGFALSK